MWSGLTSFCSLIIFSKCALTLTSQAQEPCPPTLLSLSLQGFLAWEPPHTLLALPCTWVSSLFPSKLSLAATSPDKSSLSPGLAWLLIFLSGPRSALCCSAIVNTCLPLESRDDNVSGASDTAWPTGDLKSFTRKQRNVPNTLKGSVLISGSQYILKTSPCPLTQQGNFS